MTNILSDRELRDIARRHGGSFHGPNIEHLSIPETAYFEMMRAYRKQVLLEAAELCERLDNKEHIVKTLRYELRRMAEGEKE
jgi:hypothetical protein